MSSSADMAHQPSIESLPKDLCCDEILTRLDPESLYNCKRVSKSWYDLITNRSFSLLYSEKRPKVTAFLFQSSDMYPEKLQFVSICHDQEYISDPPACLGFLDSPAILMNSCNGLLIWVVGNSRIIVSNPLANRWLPIAWDFDFLGIFAYGVAVDLGVSDHFRFVMFVEESKGCFKVRVFSTEGCFWSEGRETLVVSAQALPYGCARGVYLNGVLYWELRDHSLLAYDVVDDVECVVRLPVMKKKARVLEFREPGCLGVAKGKLCYCRVVGTVVHVWQTKQVPFERSRNWAVKYKVNLCGVMRMYPEMKFRGSQALAFLDDCCGILLSIKHGVIEFSFEDNAVRNMYKARRYISRKNANADADGYVQPSMFFTFVQSLALFNL